MNSFSLATAVCLCTATLIGCGQSPTDDDRAQAQVSGPQAEKATVDLELDPKDERIVALVAWLKRQGAALEYVEGGEWRVTEPRISDEYEVVFHIRSFPPEASEEQMRQAVKNVNLAYMLNAPAHLAMSYAGFRGKHPEAKLPKSDEELPKVGGVPITKAVERWFVEYKPDDPS